MIFNIIYFYFFHFFIYMDKNFNFDNYLTINDTKINTNDNYIKSHHATNISECVDNCNNNPNCSAIFINNPLCSKSTEHTFSKCANKLNYNNSMQLNLIEQENHYNFLCGFLEKNIQTNHTDHTDHTNQTNYPNQTDFAMIKLSDNNLLNYIDKKFNIKISSNNDFKYLSTQKIDNNLFLIQTDDINFANIFTINSHSNIVDVKTSKCITLNGKYLILSDFDIKNNDQQFIQDNLFNSIRVKTKPYLSLSLNTDVSDKKIIIAENSNRAVQSVQSVQSVQFLNIIEKNELFDSCSSNNGVDDNTLNFDKFEDINFCSNTYYKIIINLILYGIVLYFVWMITKKKFN